MVGEGGDVIHFFNDIVVESGYQPSPFIWVNGKTPTTVGDYRGRAGELISESAPIVPQELIHTQEIEDYLIEFKALFENILNEIERARPDDDLTDIYYLLDTALIAIFDLTNKLGINLVAAVIFKNKRNFQKYLKKWFGENSDLTYEQAREIARYNWQDKNEEALFFALIATFGLKSFFLEDDPVLH